MENRESDHSFNRGYPDKAKRLLNDAESIVDAKRAAKESYPDDERGQYLFIKSFMGSITDTEMEELVQKEKEKDEKERNRDHPAEE